MVNAVEEICYKRNFLTEVIARIDFASPVLGISERLPSVLQRAVLKHFPIKEPKNIVLRNVRIDAAVDDIAIERETATEWNFFGRNREKRLVIGNSALFVSYTRYQKYELFRDEFREIVDCFFSAVSDVQPSRLGLRYINQLNLDTPNPLDWNGYINAELLGIFNFNVARAERTRVFHTLGLGFENFAIRFQFGVHNPDYPAPVRQRLFVLDYDAYYEGLVEPQAISSSLDEYHAEIQNLFERSITQSTKEILNEPE